MPRDSHFAELYANPKARLATADIIPLEGRGAIKWWERPAATFMMPAANYYPRSGYAQRLEKAGLER